MQAPDQPDQNDPVLTAFEKITYEDLAGWLGDDVRIPSKTTELSPINIDESLKKILIDIRGILALRIIKQKEIDRLEQENKNLEEKIKLLENDDEKTGLKQFTEKNIENIKTNKEMLDNCKVTVLPHYKLLREISSYFLLKDNNFNITDTKSILDFLNAIKKIDISKIDTSILKKIKEENPSININEVDTVETISEKNKKTPTDSSFIKKFKEKYKNNVSYLDEKTNFFNHIQSSITSMKDLVEIMSNISDELIDSKEKNEIIELFKNAILGLQSIVDLASGFPKNSNELYQEMQKTISDVLKIIPVEILLKHSSVIGCIEKNKRDSFFKNLSKPGMILSSFKNDLSNMILKLKKCPGHEDYEDIPVIILLSTISKEIDDDQQIIDTAIEMHKEMDSYETTKIMLKEKEVSVDLSKVLSEIKTEIIADETNSMSKKKSIKNILKALKSKSSPSEKEFKTNFGKLYKILDKGLSECNISKEFGALKAEKYLIALMEILKKSPQKNQKAIKDLSNEIYSYLNKTSGSFSYNKINIVIDDPETNQETKDNMKTLNNLFFQDILHENSTLTKNNLSYTDLFSYEHNLSPSEFSFGYSAYYSDPTKTVQENLANSIKNLIEIYNALPEATDSDKKTKKYCWDALVELTLSDISLLAINDQTIPFPQKLREMISAMSAMQQLYAKNNVQKQSMPIGQKYLSEFTSQDTEIMVNIFNNYKIKNKSYLLGGSDQGESPLSELNETIKNNINEDLMICSTLDDLVNKYNQYIALANTVKKSNNIELFHSISSAICTHYLIKNNSTLKNSLIAEPGQSTIYDVKSFLDEIPNPFKTANISKNENPLVIYELISSIGSTLSNKFNTKELSTTSIGEDEFLKSIKKIKKTPSDYLKTDCTEAQLLQYCTKNLKEKKFIEDLSIVIENNGQYEKLFGEDAFIFIRQKSKVALPNIKSKFHSDEKIKITYEKNTATIYLEGSKPHLIQIAKSSDGTFTVTHDYKENSTSKDYERQKGTNKQKPIDYSSLSSIIENNANYNEQLQSFNIDKNNLKKLLNDIKTYCIKKHIPLGTLNFEEIQTNLELKEPKISAKKPERVDDLIVGLRSMYHATNIDVPLIEKYIKVEILDNNLPDSVDAIYNYLLIAHKIEKEEPALYGVVLNAIQTAIEEEPLLDWNDYSTQLKKCRQPSGLY